MTLWSKASALTGDSGMAGQCRAGHAEVTRVGPAGSEDNQFALHPPAEWDSESKEAALSLRESP